MSLCLFRLFWSDFQPKSDSSFSMLHNLVAPVMIRAASMLDFELKKVLLPPLPL